MAATTISRILKKTEYLSRAMPWLKAVNSSPRASQVESPAVMQAKMPSQLRPRRPSTGSSGSTSKTTAPVAMSISSGMMAIRSCFI